GSLLRKLAFDWGAVTGMLTNNKCFFRQVFSNPEYVEITDDMIRDEYNEYSYIPVSSIYISTYTNYPVRAGRQDKYTKLEDRYINEELLPEITDPTAIHFPHIIGKRSNTDYFIYRVQTEIIDSRSFERAVSDHPFLLRDQLKQLRGRITAPVKVFELKGINYAFLSDYVRNGVRY